jgi:hypothetical protein
MDEVTIVIPAGSTLEVVGPARVRVMPLAATATEPAMIELPAGAGAPLIDDVKPETGLLDIDPEPAAAPERPRRTVPAADVKPVFGRPKAPTNGHAGDDADASASPVTVPQRDKPGAETPEPGTTPIELSSGPAAGGVDDYDDDADYDDDGYDNDDGYVDDRDNDATTPRLRSPTIPGRPLHRDLRDRSIVHFERELTAIRGPAVERRERAPDIVTAARTARSGGARDRDRDDDEPIPLAETTDHPARGSGYRVINGDGDEMWVYGVVDWCHAILDALSKSWDPRRVWFDNKGTFDALLMQASGSDAKHLAGVRADAERRIRIALKARR